MRIISMALITALGLSVTACGSTTANRSVYSERQPVVSKANYVLDLSAGNGGLSSPASPAGSMPWNSDMVIA